MNRQERRNERFRPNATKPGWVTLKGRDQVGQRVPKKQKGSLLERVARWWGSKPPGKFFGVQETARRRGQIEKGMLTSAMRGVR